MIKEVKFVKENKWRDEKVTLLLLVMKGKGRREGEQGRKRMKPKE